MALHGAAGLLSALLEEGVPRDDVEAALSRLLDDIEQQIAEDGVIGRAAAGDGMIHRIKGREIRTVGTYVVPL